MDIGKLRPITARAAPVTELMRFSPHRARHHYSQSLSAADAAEANGRSQCPQEHKAAHGHGTGFDGQQRRPRRPGSAGQVAHLHRLENVQVPLQSGRVQSQHPAVECKFSICVRIQIYASDYLSSRVMSTTMFRCGSTAYRYKSVLKLDCQVPLVLHKMVFVGTLQQWYKLFNAAASQLNLSVNSLTQWLRPRIPLHSAAPACEGGHLIQWACSAPCRKNVEKNVLKLCSITTWRKFKSSENAGKLVLQLKQSIQFNNLNF